MYPYEIKEKLAKRLKKIALKDSTRFNKKIVQIADNPMLGKPFVTYSKAKEEFISDHMF
jgi:mRNA-degrading endonuclease RelE of RelBE toxin-antitoxin system